MRRAEHVALVAHHLHVVGDEALLEHAEPGAGADVGAHLRSARRGATWRAIGKMPDARNALLEGQWATAVRGGCQPGELVVGDVDVVGQHGALAQQAGALVGIDVVARGREQLAHEVDLARALVDVAGEQRAAVSSSSARQTSSIASVQETEKRGVTA